MNDPVLSIMERQAFAIGFAHDPNWRSTPTMRVIVESLAELDKIAEELVAIGGIIEWQLRSDDESIIIGLHSKVGRVLFIGNLNRPARRQT